MFDGKILSWVSVTLLTHSLEEIKTSFSFPDQENFIDCKLAQTQGE